MRIAYLDTIAGIAGDMTMAAFVAAGVPLDRLVGELRKLPVTGFELDARHVHRNSIGAVQVDVVVSPEPHAHRNLGEVLSIIEESSLPPRVRERASAVFRVIAEAEAAVHRTTIDRVHFHEVGALDSIVDIVGVAVCLELCSVERVYTSPVRLGSGAMVKTRHGLMPVPTPATVEILRGYPTVLTMIPHELTTPTGAGIVRALSDGVLDAEVLRPERIGYGAGSLEIPEAPNLLRVILGELEQRGERDEVLVVETNIDDMNPQLFPQAIEQLLASGALDAYLVPVIMKKGRPGILLSALVERPNLDPVVETFFRQTSTIGLRIQPVARRKLPRREVVIETPYGPMRAKAVVRDGKEVIAPEFEECRRVAEEQRIPLRDVLRAVEAALGTG